MNGKKCTATNKRGCCTTKKDDYFAKNVFKKLKTTIENQHITKSDVCTSMRYLLKY